MVLDRCDCYVAVGTVRSTRRAAAVFESRLSLMDVDLDVPDHTTLSRRSQHLTVANPRIPAKGPIDLIVDRTGLSIVGAGE